MERSTTVQMPVTQYLKEHDRLIKLLDKSNDPALQKEAKRQKLEISEYLKKRGY